MSIEVEQRQSPIQQQAKQQHILWRRERIAELSAQGRTEREIAAILKVSLGTVSRDTSILNKQAQDNLRYHIQERLPARYQSCQNGLSQVLKMAWNIVTQESINHTNKLQALSLISDIYKYQLELSTNSGIITQAMAPEDHGANPPEYVLAALNGCLITSLIYHASAKGINIDEVESTLSGDVDLHGFLALDEKVRNGYEKIKVTLKIKSDESEQKLRELVELAQNRSPVFDIVSHPTAVEPNQSEAGIASRLSFFFSPIP
jgi:uncharacterized OsmC-like protein/DNA-binding CsgD family transcriptional regulator